MRRIVIIIITVLDLVSGSYQVEPVHLFVMRGLEAEKVELSLKPMAVQFQYKAHRTKDVLRVNQDKMIGQPIGDMINYIRKRLLTP